MKRLALCLLVALPLVAPAQDQKPQRTVTVNRKDGATITGLLVRVDADSAVVKVKDSTLTVPLEAVASIVFGGEKQAPASARLQPPPFALKSSIDDMLAEEVYDARDQEIIQPVILHKEKAKYTKEARDHGTEGVVVVSAVFTAEGKITGLRVIRSLPDGLTEKAIEALQKIRFKPARKDGKAVSVRMQVEFDFALDRSR